MNNDQWGNIELPGFDDNKLLDPQLNRVLAAKEKIGDERFSAKMKSIAATRSAEYKQAQKQGCQQRDNTYQAESNSREEVRAKISRALAGRVKSAEHNAKVAASNRARAQDPEQHAKLMAGLAKRDRQFHAGPYGIHPSLNAAARYAKEQGLANALKKFEKWKTTDPTNYYFLEKQ